LTGIMGLYALRVLFALAVFSIFVHVASIKTKKRIYRKASRILMLALFLVTLFASLSLVWLLASENFSYAYVVEYTSRELPVIYRIAAFWGGSAGSLLFWLLVLSFYGVTISYSKHDNCEEMLPIVSIIITVIMAFYVILLNFAAFPFERISPPPTDGNGLNPLLQNPGMTVHPVNLYLGYIGFTIPYAYAMAGLLLSRTDTVWLTVTRRWTLISWVFLGIGIIYGAHWSYEELGWGGYWAWDPVENASILPWFTATAFLHSALVQERRGMLRLWNVILITMTFLLTLFGTYLVRSGAIWSIHAFTNGPMGRFFLIFIAILFIFSVSVIVLRLPIFRESNRFESVVSREASFVINNVLFLAIACIVLWGTLYPITSRYLLGQQMVVGESYYNSVVLPVAVCVLMLMGIGQIVSWRKDSCTLILVKARIPFVLALAVTILFTILLFHQYGHIFYLAMSGLFAASFAIFSIFTLTLKRLSHMRSHKLRDIFRSRRWFGAQIVHISFAVIAVGIIASGGFHVDKQVNMSIRNQVQIGNYHVEFVGMGMTNASRGAEARKIYANLIVSRGTRVLGVMRPAAYFYQDGQAPMESVTLYSRPLMDFYVVMLGMSKDNQHAIFDFHLNPLVEWIWFGGYLLIFGTLLSLWPDSLYRKDKVVISEGEN
jgi:cytochrome c-type biogenesis protein CcmF